MTPLATASPSPVPTASGTAAVPTAGGPVVLSGLGYTLTLNLSAADAFPAGTTMSYTFSTSATKAGSVRRSQGTRATSDRKNLVTVTVQVNNAGSVDPAPSVDATVPSGTTLPTDPKRLTLDVYDHSNPTAGVTPFGGSATYGPAANNVHFTGLANSVVKHFQPNVSYDFYIDDNGDIQPIVSPSPSPSSSLTPSPTPAPTASPTPVPTATPSPTATPAPSGDLGTFTYYLDEPNQGETIGTFTTPFTSPPVPSKISPPFSAPPILEFQADHAGDLIAYGNSTGLQYLPIGATSTTKLNVPVNSALVALDPAGHLYVVDYNGAKVLIEYTIGANGMVREIGRVGLSPDFSLATAEASMVVDGSGNVYLKASLASGGIGVLVYTGGSNGSLSYVGALHVLHDSSVQFAHSMGVDAAGNLYLASRTSSNGPMTVLRYSTLSIGSAPSTGSFSLPNIYDIAVAPNGVVLVVGHNLNAIEAYRIGVGLVGQETFTKYGDPFSDGYFIRTRP